MLLYLKCPATPNDWFIIELQGEISAEGNEAELSVAGLSFADISEREVCPVLYTLSSFCAIL